MQTSRAARTLPERIDLAYFRVRRGAGSSGAGFRLVDDSRREIAWALGDLMIRYFLVMAVTGASLLVADFVLGFFATGEPHGPGAIARGIHVLFSLVTVVVLLGIHSIVYTYFVATGKWAKEVVAGLSTARLDQHAGEQEQDGGRFGSSWEA